MNEHLVQLFPGLVGKVFHVTSPADESYNCVAWAAGVADAWWWPVGDPKKTHWPSGAPRIETLDAFRQAFESVGYSVCQSEAFEAGFEKLALFCDSDVVPTHASRQRSDGWWTSKLGQLEDIEHGLRDLEGSEYGTVVLIMRRPALG